LRLQDEFERVDLDDVLTTVTFNDPVGSRDVVEFISAYDVTPELIYVYGEEAGRDGYVTGGIYFEGGEDIRKIAEMVNEAEQDIKESGVTFIGVLSVIGEVSSRSVGTLQNDRKVYLADVSADEYFGRNVAGDDYVQHVGYELYSLKQQR
jgi:hypothetical protein